MGTDVWLVGAGPMAVAHHAVLTDLGATITVIGRGPTSAAHFADQSGQSAHEGGLEAWLAREETLPELAVVATSVESLAQSTITLLRAGVRRVLVEKPAGIDLAQIAAVAAAAAETGAEVLVAYNRRCYASVQAAKRMIDEDGGVSSLIFEFTELADAVAASVHPEAVKHNWFLANSTHVVDLAFFLGGRPTELTAYVAGALDWHPAAARFAGAGRTDRGATFSYAADWAAPGRWGVEVMTARRRLVLRPIEQLQVQQRGSFTLDDVALDADAAGRFKPGLHAMLREVLVGGRGPLPTIDEHAECADSVYRVMREPSVR